MSNMYIRSQDREKLYRLGGNYACVEYGSVTKRAKKGQEPKETHRIFISDGVLEEIGTYETKERCLEIIDEIQKVSVSYLYSAGSPGFLKGAPAFPPFAAEIPRIYEMPENKRMTLEQFIEPIHNITRIRIVKGKGSRYETGEADVYIGWLGILREDKSQISKEIWRAEVKDFAVVPDIRHKDWQKLGLMKPLEPGEHPQYKFSDLTMTLYYTFFI